jgi:DNA mismatch repair protein MutL
MTARVIHILPEQVASRIAAGEVVERPASAVKELVENALDAGARTITVGLRRGGGDLIEVNDDGCGMGPQDALVALRRHATSKIRDAADLVAIATLGFRGEALAAIASVARCTIRTRRAVDPVGLEIVTEGGDDPRTAPCAIAPGTRVEVRDLFFNTPARLKFLKTVATEQAAVVDALQRLALGHYRVAFSLTADDRILLAVPPAASAQERFRQLFGARVAERMLPFATGGEHPGVWGLAAGSQESFASPRLLLSYVNRRAVRDRALIRAITQAYQNLLPRGRYPAVALFLELPPAEVDVNVHPMKTEVRFRRAGAVFETVYRTLRARLADQAAIAAPTPPPTAPATIVLPSAASPIDRIAVSPAPPPAAVNQVGGERSLRLVADAGASTPAQTALKLGFGHSALAPQMEPTAAVPPLQAVAPRYAALRVVGQIFAGYIALEGADGLLLIDQHAAHERVVFERLKAELHAGGVRVQPMLTPATLELDPARAARVRTALPELAALGFELEPFGAQALVLKGAPAIFGSAGGIGLLRDLIDALGDQGLGARGALDDALKTLACHGSIRAGRTLHPNEISQLLADLDATAFKTNCPHGRPVHIEWRLGTIERMFRR